jgi:hypothetical protein
VEDLYDMISNENGCLKIQFPAVIITASAPPSRPNSEKAFALGFGLFMF